MFVDYLANRTAKWFGCVGDVLLFISTLVGKRRIRTDVPYFEAGGEWERERQASIIKLSSEESAACVCVALPTHTNLPTLLWYTMPLLLPFGKEKRPLFS